jgi:hypothetical protein
MGSAFHYQGDGLDFWFYVHTETDAPARTMKMMVMEASARMFAGATPIFSTSDLQKVEKNIRAHLLKFGMGSDVFGPNDKPSVEFKWRFYGVG